MEFPQQQKPAGDGKIIYPPGIKEITDKISNDEVVKRLKVKDNPLLPSTMLSKWNLQTGFLDKNSSQLVLVVVNFSLST